MIPVRVHVRDFLCYEHGADGGAVTFDFEGSRLWSISGDNGAGKSAIFDAIRYALYGEHRDGSQRDARLIRRGAASCEVMFEFRSDGKLYRVRRTVGRARGKSPIEPKTWQAALYDEAELAWLPIAGTDRKDGLDSWVEDRLGLTYGTFIASVLLLQGESDRLTRAASKERFEILSGLLALEAYERLANAARDAARLHRSQTEQLEARLIGQPAVRDEDLDAAMQAAMKADEELATTQSDVAQTATLVAAATTYERLTEELARLTAALVQIDTILANGPRIREEHVEWSSLSEGIPRMRQALAAVRGATEKEGEAATLSLQIAGIDLVALRDSVDAAVRADDVASTAVDAAGTSLDNHFAALDALRPKLATLEQHEAATQRVADVTKELSSLRGQLTGLKGLEEACAEGRTLREALPLIKQIRVGAKRVDELENQVSTLRAELVGLAGLEEECTEGRTLRDALALIKPIRAAAKRVVDLTSQLSTLRGQLTELTGLQEACAEGRTLREALPVIRLISERQLVTVARQEEVDRIGNVKSWGSKISALEQVVGGTSAKLELAERERSALLSALARAEQQHENSCCDLAARLEAKDEGVCSRCGQNVSPEHMKLELSHARARAAATESVLRDARASANAGETAAATAADEVNGAKEELAAAKQALAEAQVCANELAASQANLLAARDNGARTSAAVQRIVREATLDPPMVTIEVIERKVRDLPEVERQVEKLRGMEGNARAIETQLAEERATLQSLSAERDDVEGVSAAVRRVVGEATQGQPTVTVEAIERKVLRLAEIERQIEVLRGVEGQARAIEKQLAQERATVQSLLAARDDDERTPVAVQRVVREATLDQPTVTVEAIEARVLALPDIERQIATLRGVEGNVRAVETQLAQEGATLESLEQQLPFGERQRVRAEAARLEEECEAARVRRTKAHEAMRAAQSKAKEARDTLESAQVRRGALESVARELALGATRLREQAEMRLEEIALPVRDAVLRGDETIIELAEARLVALAHAQSAYQDLADATDRRLAVASKIEATSLQAANMPIEHRVSTAAAHEQHSKAAARLVTAQRQRDDAREALRQLRACADLRRDLETQRVSSRRRADLYGRLAELLGRTGLQAVLMDEAIAGIGELANETLNRISGGQLRLVMERETTGRGEEIRIHAIDLGSSDDALDVAFLSGSQKFRVAVALAAGVGQYSAGTNRIRALIIDEGFGSLDDQGRQQMVDELRTLSTVLERVIVVSHQEDFQDRTLFPTGYVLRKANQQTEVLRFV